MNTQTIVVGAIVLFLVLQSQKPAAAAVQAPAQTTQAPTPSKPTAGDLAKDALGLLQDLYNAFKQD
jgi:hypothetical protein